MTLMTKKNIAANKFRCMIISLTAERQKPRFAKNEAFEVESKVGISNPVRRHNTLYALLIQDCPVIHQPYKTLARDGYTNGSGYVRRGATAFNSRKQNGHDLDRSRVVIDPQTLDKLANGIGAPSEVYKLAAISAHFVSVSIRCFNRAGFANIGQLLI